MSFLTIRRLEGWISCVNCGHRYGSFLSACPRCGRSNTYEPPVQTSDSGRGRKIGVIAVIAVVAIIIFALLPVSQIFSTVERLVPDSGSGDAKRDSESDRTAPHPDANPDTGQTSQVTQTESSSGIEGGRIAPPVLSSSLDIDELREYALSKVNKDRADFGLPPVALSENQAAQVHAQDVLSTRKISHWMTNGEKPHMTYTRFGGSGSVAQNVATSGYDEEDANTCRVGIARCTPVNPVDAIDRVQYSMMYDDAHADWGHRDNIIDKHHTHVSLGIAYDDYFFAFVQNFENNYVDWEMPITYDASAGDVSMRGTLLEGVTVSSINIFYDPLPSEQVYAQHRDDSFYDLGQFAAIVVEPPPPGAYYEETDEFVLVTGEEWRIDDQNCDISFSVDRVYERFGEGAYTVVMWAEKGDDAVAITTTSFVRWTG